MPPVNTSQPVLSLAPNTPVTSALADKGPAIAPYLAKCVRNRMPVTTLTPGVDLKILGNSPTLLGYDTLPDLVSACGQAVQGSPRSTIIRNTVLSSDLYNVSAGTAAAGIKVFGWLLRINASQQNFAFDSIQVDVGLITNTGGTLSMAAANVALSFIMKPNNFPVDVLVLSVESGGGQYTVVPGQNQEVVASGATSATNGVKIYAVDANTKGYIEGLNSRDLLWRPNSRVSASASNDGERWDASYDIFNDGIRDEIRYGMTHRGAYDGVR